MDSTARAEEMQDRLAHSPGPIPPRSPARPYRLQGIVEGDAAGQEISESRLARDAECPMERAAARVAVHHHRTLAGVRERERQVGREERLAVALTGAGNRGYHGTSPIRVHEVQAHAAHRLEHLNDLVIGVVAVAPFYMRQHTEDGKPDLTGDLIRVPDPRIHAL